MKLEHIRGLYQRRYVVVSLLVVTTCLFAQAALAQTSGSERMQYNLSAGEDGRPFSLTYSWGYSDGLESHRVQMNMSSNAITVGGRRFTADRLQQFYAERAARSGTRIGMEDDIAVYGPGEVVVEATVRAGSGGATQQVPLTFGFFDNRFSGPTNASIGGQTPTQASLGISHDEFRQLTRNGLVEVVNARIVEVRWNHWFDSLAAAIADPGTGGEESDQSARSDAAQGRGGSAGSGGSDTAGRSRTSPPDVVRRPSTPTPPPSPNTDYGQYVDEYAAEEFRRQQAVVGAVGNFFDEIAAMQRSEQNRRRWDAAASLETSGQSPEALIRQVEQKKRELDQLAEQRRAEHRRDMQELRAEADRTIEDAQSSEEAIVGAIAGLGALGGEIVGDISIQRQQRRAEEDLERQLTEEFERIQQQVFTDIDRSVDTAEQGKAQTLFPEEFTYFEQVISYYGSYRSQVQSGFSIDDTQWLYPQQQQPRVPRLPRRPNYTAGSAAELMAAKWAMIENNGPHAGEAHESLDFLTAYAMDQFSERPEPYYYRSLLTDEVLDRYLLSRRASEIARRNPYRGKARRDFSALTNAFFSALEQNNRSLVRRVWNVGLLSDMRHSTGDGAYLFALRSNVSALDHLLSLHDSSSRSELAQRLLILAASEGVVDGVSVLIERGARADRREGETGMTPVLAAASNGQLEVVGVLERDYRINARSALDDANNRNLRSAQYYLSLYLVERAVTRDNPALLGNALRYEPEVVNASYRDETSYLGYAVAEGRTRFLTAARETNVDPNSTDPSGKGMLAIAMEKGAQDSMFRFLIDWGASLATPGPGGRTTLHWAVEEHRPELVSYLLDQDPPINQQDGTGRTPLMAAIAAENEESVRSIMSLTPDYALQDGDGQAALHYAVQHLEGEVFTAILRATANVEIPDNGGNTPLHLALASAEVPKAQELLAFESAIDIQNNRGESYLHVAARNVAEMIDPLLERNASVNLVDRSGNTPLHVSIMAQQTAASIRLLRHGADPAMSNQAGDAPVHVAIKQQRPAWLSLVRSSTVEVPDEEGNTPIHLVMNRGWGAAGSLIKTHNVDPNSTNRAGQSYLHIAAQNGDRLTADMLIEAGAEVNVQDEAGNTPLHYAAGVDALEVVTVLLQAGADSSLSNNEGDTARDIAGAEEYGETEDFIRTYSRRPSFFRRLVGEGR